MKTLNSCGVANLAAQARLCQAATPSYGAWTDPFPAADVAAWILVGLLVFCISCFAVGAYVLAKRYKAPGSSQIQDDAQPPLPSPLNPAREGDESRAEEGKASWERDSDWWKK